MIRGTALWLLVTGSLNLSSPAPSASLLEPEALQQIAEQATPHPASQAEPRLWWDRTLVPTPVPAVTTAGFVPEVRNDGDFVPDYREDGEWHSNDPYANGTGDERWRSDRFQTDTKGSGSMLQKGGSKKWWWGTPSPTPSPTLSTTAIHAFTSAETYTVNVLSKQVGEAYGDMLEQGDDIEAMVNQFNVEEEKGDSRTDELHDYIDSMYDVCNELRENLQDLDEVIRQGDYEYRTIFDDELNSELTKFIKTLDKQLTKLTTHMDINFEKGAAGHTRAWESMVRKAVKEDTKVQDASFREYSKELKAVTRISDKMVKDNRYLLNGAKYSDSTEKMSDLEAEKASVESKAISSLGSASANVVDEIPEATPALFAAYEKKFEKSLAKAEKDLYKGALKYIKYMAKQIVKKTKRDKKRTFQESEDRAERRGERSEAVQKTNEDGHQIGEDGGKNRRSFERCDG
jgi:hypothetical protein